MRIQLTREAKILSGSGFEMALSFLTDQTEPEWQSHFIHRLDEEPAKRMKCSLYRLDRSQIIEDVYLAQYSAGLHSKVKTQSG